MSSSQFENIRSLIMRLNPSLTPKGTLQLTFPNKTEGTPLTLPISCKRQTKDKAKERLSQHYKRIYKDTMSLTACSEAVKHVIAELKVSTLASEDSVDNSVRYLTEANTQPTAHSPQPSIPQDSLQPLDETQSLDYSPQPTEETQPILEKMKGVRGFFIDRSKGTILQMDRDTKQLEPIEHWQLPIIHQRTMYKSPTGSTKTEIECTINGVRRIVERQDLMNGKYTSYFSIRGVGMKYMRDVYGSLVADEAENIPLTETYTTTGFYEYDEAGLQKWGYMLPTGKFITEAGCRENVRLASSISDEQVKLWDKFDTHLEPSIEDIAAMYAFLKGIAPSCLPLLLTSHNARAIGHFLQSDSFRSGHGIMIYGDGGTGKTETSSLCRGIGQPYVYKGKLDARFEDTVTDIECGLSFLKDIPVILDDLNKAKKGDKDSSTNERKINWIVRAIYSGNKVRGRRTSTLAKHQENFIQTLITITSEYYPHDMQRSIFRRMLTVQVQKGDIHKTISDEYPYSLEQANGYAYTLFAVGRKMILNFIQYLNTRGYEATVAIYEEVYGYLRQAMRTRFIAYWQEKQPSCILPDDIDNLIDVISQILLGSYFIDEVTEGVTSFVADTEDVLLEVLYLHVCRMEGLSPDEEDNLPFASALLEMWEMIGTRSTFVLDGVKEVLKISDYHSDTPPSLAYEDGTVIPDEQWGHYSSQADDRRIEPKISMYVKKDKRRGYISQIGLKALLYSLKRKEQYSHISEIREVTAIADKEGWIPEDGYGEDRNKLKKRNSQHSTERCLVIDIDRFMSLMKPVQEEGDTVIKEAEKIVAIASEKQTYTSKSIDDLLG